MYCCIYASGNLPILLDCARQFSPLIETHSDMVVFDARGLEGLRGSPESLAQAVERAVGIPASIAIASNPDAAVHAARGIAGVTVIPLGKEGSVLAPLPLYLLGGSADVALSLDLWGIRSFGEFAALPPIGVAARLGDEGIHLQRLASGAGFRRLRIAKDELKFDTEMDLDSPIELLDSLCFVFQRLLDDLLGRLVRASLSTNEIRVRLALECAPDHITTLRLPVPMTESKDLMKMLYLELSENPPPKAILKVFVHAEPVEPRRTQHGLFAPASPEAEKLETTLARVRHFVGKENVGSPYLLNTHRADRFVMHAFLPPPIAGTEPKAREFRLCLRRFRPPYGAHVRLENRRPVYVIAPAMRGVIVNSRGPWRMSGNWWSEDVWNRDRWDVALDSGVLYRLFEEIGSGRWFVEGSYD
jgi:protein ImuB